MRRLTLLTLVVALMLVLAGGVAYANFAIHGGYVADTDACAGCHRAHTATSMITWLDKGGTSHNALLVGPPTDQVYIFCYVCHSAGAPGAATDVEQGILDTTLSPGGALDASATVNAPLNGGGFSTAYYAPSGTLQNVTSFHEYLGGSPQAWGSSKEVAYNIKMDCISCHDPHGSSNYRILKDYVNGHEVGGFLGNVASDPDPDPYPWVISAETGYPYAGDVDPLTGTVAPTDGFRKHRQYPTYTPSYTWARYAKGSNGLGVEEKRTGMSGWCTACHENYMNAVGVTPNAKYTATATVGDGTISTPNSNDVDWDADRRNTVVAILQGNISSVATTLAVDSSVGFETNYPGYLQIGTEVMRYTNITGNVFTVVRGQNNTPATAHVAGDLVYQAYDASDGYGYVARHRHPVNVELSRFAGPTNLTYNPFVFQSTYPGPTITFVDLPLDHSRSEKGNVQTYGLTDLIECLTCHRAHGVSSQMTGYANAGLSLQSFPGGWGNWLAPNPSLQTGVPPASGNGASQLLRADNRGVCERCHNK